MKPIQSQARNRQDGNQVPILFRVKKRKIGGKKREKKPDVARLEEKQDGFIQTRKREKEEGGDIDKRAGLYYDK